MCKQILDASKAGVDGGRVELRALADDSGCTGEFATERASDELSNVFD